MTLKPARLQWSENGDLESLDYGDVYFQRGAGFAESDYVFLQHNRLQERFAHMMHGGFSVAELGFGTGMNFLLTAQLFLQTAPDDAYLVFTSIEKHPIEKDILAQIYAHWPDYADITRDIIAGYPPMIEGFHTILLSGGRIRLTLCFGDVADVLPRLSGTFDAWFLDGFSPAKNPDMWREDLFPLIAARTKAGGTLATFSVTGHMRRALKSLGFDVQKVKGFGIKWSMTMAQKLGDATPPDPPRHIAVIGAGIAGCSAAYALARRGHRVTLIDRRAEIAAETSGNPVGIVYPKMTAAPSAMSAYHAQGFCHTRMLADFLGLTSWHACGVTHLDKNAEEAARHEKMITRAGLPPAYAYHDDKGLHQPLAGYLSPPEFCAKLAAHAGIKMMAGTEITRIVRSDKGWQIYGGDDSLVTTADDIVIAMSHGSRLIDFCDWLPLQSLRGQMTALRPTENSAHLDHVICHEGYITPAVDGIHYIGATFQKEPPATPDIRAQDDAENIARLNEYLPDLGMSESHIAASRSGYRAATPDKLPMIGPAPDAPRVLDDFAALRLGGRTPDIDIACIENVYISTGYGAHGMTDAPLGGEIIAAMISGEPLPVPQDMAESVAPARFLLRGLKRGTL